MRHFLRVDGVAFNFEAPQPEDFENWHRAYFCVFCGDVWARWEHEGASQFFAVHRSCERHRAYTTERPGSLVLARDDIALLPGPLLVRELMLGEGMAPEMMSQFRFESDPYLQTR